MAQKRVFSNFTFVVMIIGAFIIGLTISGVLTFDGNKVTTQASNVRVLEQATTQSHPVTEITGLNTYLGTYLGTYLRDCKWVKTALTTATAVTSEVTVQCGADYKVIAGGCILTTGYLRATSPNLDGTGWKCKPAVSAVTNAYAFCCKGTIIPA